MKINKLLSDSLNESITNEIIDSINGKQKEIEVEEIILDSGFSESKESITVGVVVTYNGKFWGVAYDDGKSKAYDWVSDLDEIIISDERFLKNPIDLTYENSPYIKELKKGRIVKVIKTVNTKFEII